MCNSFSSFQVVSPVAFPHEHGGTPVGKLFLVLYDGPQEPSIYRYAVPPVDALINQPRAFHSFLQGNCFLYLTCFHAFRGACLCCVMHLFRGRSNLLGGTLPKLPSCCGCFTLPLLCRLYPFFILIKFASVVQAFLSIPHQSGRGRRRTRARGATPWHSPGERKRDRGQPHQPIGAHNRRAAGAMQTPLSLSLRSEACYHAQCHFLVLIQPVHNLISFLRREHTSLSFF